ncbi:unnamed protein product [Rotaria magnacalcarata]|uniref:Uncharacterized protein n=1 Tax=Rotaria magnacalcarata TaxID=392030 RepID=A0A818WLW6_9BILA|nr:unnamed protein product [Rotaria magnacalcarata]CAF3841416.1 unnamed protein product [Rotaria magnacalcarata]CAF3894470.1 unnamed protein product [Rotaria magnacalcarata]
MYKSVHCHEQRNTTTRVPSPVLFVNDPIASIPTNQLSNLINYAQRKNNPEIFSVYDFNQWPINHKYDENSIHSAFVPYYYINDINDIFVLFTTKQLLEHTQFTSLLQIEKSSNCSVIITQVDQLVSYTAV